jgi:hypothetical protein
MLVAGLSLAAFWSQAGRTGGGGGVQYSGTQTGGRVTVQNVGVVGNGATTSLNQRAATFEAREGWRGYSVGLRGQTLFEMDSNVFNIFKRFQKSFNFHLSKKDIPELKKFEIKYGFEGFDGRNNFLYRNFFRFKVDVEWKFREALWFEFH